MIFKIDLVKKYLRSQYWIPSIVFLVSFCLHVSLMSKGPVTVDCLNLIINSQATINTHHLHYLFGSGYPLMVLLGAIFISIGEHFGITDPCIAVNFIGVVFGSIAVLTFYLLVQKICDTLTAILASFLLLLNPLFLDVSTYGINHAPALCFLLLGILSLLRFQTEGGIPDLMFSALNFGFLGATRLQDLILTFPAVGLMFIIGLKAKPQQNKVRYLFLFMTTIMLIVILFHLPYFIFDRGNYESQAKIFWKMGVIDNFKGLFPVPLMDSLVYIIKAFNVIGIFCFGAGLYYIAKFNKKLLTLIILWVTIPLSFYGNAVTSAPRFFNIMLPAIIIPISIFLTQMLKNKKGPWNIITLISFLTIIFQPLLDTEQTFIRRHEGALISDFYRWVSKSTESNATIICSDDGPFITYYSRRNVLNRPAIIGYSPRELINFKKKLDNILNNRKPVYITSFVLADSDYHMVFRNLMKQNYHLIDEGQMPLELWYETPYNTQLHLYSLVKVDKKI